MKPARTFVREYWEVVWPDGRCLPASSADTARVVRKCGPSDVKIIHVRRYRLAPSKPSRKRGGK